MNNMMLINMYNMLNLTISQNQKFVFVFHENFTFAILKMFFALIEIIMHWMKKYLLSMYDRISPYYTTFDENYRLYQFITRRISNYKLTNVILY